MNIFNVIDPFMEYVAEGNVSNEEGLKYMAELLIEEIKNTSPEELAKRIKNAVITKHKREEGTVLEGEITLSGFYEPEFKN